MLSGYKNDFYLLNKNLIVMLFSEQLNYYTTIQKVFQVLQYFTKAVILRRDRRLYDALFKRILAWKRGISKRQFIEIVSLLVVFHLPYSKYKGVKICFYSCYENQTFSLVWHSCRSFSTRVVLVLHLCRLCVTPVASVALVSQSCRSCHSCLALLL